MAGSLCFIIYSVTLIFNNNYSKCFITDLSVKTGFMASFTLKIDNQAVKPVLQPYKRFYSHKPGFTVEIKVFQ